MAYNKNNYVKRTAFIISIYNFYKKPDLPDTTIVRVYFPKHFIFISYREWCKIKGEKVISENIIHDILPRYEQLTELLKDYKSKPYKKEVKEEKKKTKFQF